MGEIHLKHQYSEILHGASISQFLTNGQLFLEHIWDIVIRNQPTN